MEGPREQPTNCRHPTCDPGTGRCHTCRTARRPPKRLTRLEETVVFARRQVLRSSFRFGPSHRDSTEECGIRSSRRSGGYPFPGEPVKLEPGRPSMHTGRDGTPPSDGIESRSGTPPRRPSEAVSMNDVTRILSAIEQGDSHAAEQLLPLVYDELRKLAAQRLAREKPGQTLQATALVHEAYLRLVGDGQPRDWNGRGHFFAAAAEAMRRILINRARDKHRLRRHGQRARVDLEAITDLATTSDADLLELDDALGRLAGTSAQAGRTGEAQILCRPDIAGGRRGARARRPQRRPPVGVRPGLADRRPRPQMRAGQENQETLAHSRPERGTGERRIAERPRTMPSSDFTASAPTPVREYH